MYICIYDGYDDDDTMQWLTIYDKWYSDKFTIVIIYDY
jgi:hypothetical protein